MVFFFQIPNDTLRQNAPNINFEAADSDVQVKTKGQVLKISMLLLGPAESGKSTLLKQMKVSVVLPVLKLGFYSGRIPGSYNIEIPILIFTLYLYIVYLTF